MTFHDEYAIKDGPKGVDSTTAALITARSYLAMTKPNLPLIDRFMQYVMPEPNSGCWLWIGAITKKGYGGNFRVGKKTNQPHRLSYSLYKGSIPDGLHIDHLCRVPCCVNPDHLEAVTPAENSRRAVPFGTFGTFNRNKTHCKRGHKFTTENTGYDPNGARRCRKCARAASIRSAKKRKEGRI